jgi:hypothetical protein
MGFFFNKVLLGQILKPLPFLLCILSTNPPRPIIRLSTTLYKLSKQQRRSTIYFKHVNARARFFQNKAVTVPYDITI